LAVAVQDRESDRRHHQQLKEHDRRHQRAGAQHVRRDRDAEVSGVHVRRGQYADGRLSPGTSPDHRGHEQIEHLDDEQAGQVRQQDRREDRVQVRPGYSGEQQSRRRHEERQPGQNQFVLGPQYAEPADEVAQQGNRNQSDEGSDDSRHR
jgi:hypothetical protein